MNQKIVSQMILEERFAPLVIPLFLTCKGLDGVRVWMD